MSKIIFTPIICSEFLPARGRVWASILALSLVAWAVQPVSAQVILTEFMADNDGILADEDGEFEDWIELYNTGTETVDLAGWSLTDESDDLTKWVFPSTNLNSGAFLVVFASGKDRSAAGQALHTNFKLASDGEYLALVEPGGTQIATEFTAEYPEQFSNVSFGFGSVLTSQTLLATNAPVRLKVPTDNSLGTGWTAIDYNDTSWSAGVNGVGYDTGETDPLEANFAASVLTTGPVLYWRMGETNSGTAVNLGSLGQSGDGSYEGDVIQGIAGPRAPEVSGFEPDNVAIDCDGSDDYVSGPGGLLSDRGAFAIAAWIRPDVLSANRIGLVGQNDVAEFGFMGNRLEMYTGTAGSVSYTYPHPVGEWHHVVAQGTGSAMELYVDGQLVSSVSRSSSSYGSSSYALNAGGGGIWDTSGNHFPGAIDEVAVWHRALSAQEISDLIGPGSGPGVDYTPYIATDVESEMRGTSPSVFLRFPFNVTSPADIDQLALRIRYDDGFVAYLNGAEMARRYAPGTLSWDAGSTARHPDILAVELEEFDVSASRSFLVPGNNVLALHGLNISSTNVDFLSTAELISTAVGNLSTQGLFMVTPTPGSGNVAGVDELGPLVQELTHTPLQPADHEDLLVTARISTTINPVAGATLHYRVMFASEVAVAMNDSGSLGDVLAGDGIWSARVPASAATVGKMIRYYVTALDTGGLSSRWPLFADPLDSEEYFGTVVNDPSVVSDLPVLHQFINDWAAADTGAGTRCSLFYQGEFYDNVRIDLHGQTSSGFPKKSHDIDFNRDHRFKAKPDERRVKDIKLMTNWADKAHVRSSLAYDMIEASGSVGHFAFQVRVQRDGEFYAITDMMEDGDNRWLDRVGLDSNGALYKMYNNLGSASGEKKTRKDEDFTDLQALVSNLSESRAINDRVLYAYDNLDLPQTISYFTALALISSQDHGHKNYYVYRDSDGSGEWTILPWDIDLSWGRNWIDSSGYFSDTLYQDNELDFYNSAQQNKGENRLYELIFDHPDFRRMYLRRLRTVMDTILMPTGTLPADLVVETRIQEMMELMDPTGVVPSDADLDYQKWGTWGANYTMRQDAARIINTHLPGRRSFLFDPGTLLRGEGIPAAQPADVSITLGTVEYNPLSGLQEQEYIELINPNAFAVDISGWKLGDGVEHTFRPGTVIPAGASLYASPDVVAFRARTVGPGGGQNLYVQGNYKGQLNAWGETVTLTDPNGRLVATSTYPGTPSLEQEFLRITEIMYNPSGDGSGGDASLYEFIEVKNVGPYTLDLSGVRFTNGILFDFTGSAVTSLAPGATALVVSDLVAFTSRYGTGYPVAGVYTGRLDNKGERIRLVDSQMEKILDFDFNNAWYRLTDGFGFSLEAVNEQTHWSQWGKRIQWRSSGSLHGSPGTAGAPTTISPIRINEALTHTDLPSVDTIELFNPTAGTVDVGGWFLSDEFYTPRKFRIPIGIEMTDGSYLTITEPLFNPTPGVDPSFALSSTGDEIYLFSADASSNLTGYVHGFSFGAAENGVSFGLHPTSLGEEHFVAQSANTLNGANAGPLVGPIVISEIMYHPMDVDGRDNALDEFIECRNMGSSTVALYDPAFPTNLWRLSQAVDYEFPPGTTLAAGEMLLVVGFDPADSLQVGAFRAAYGLAPGVPLYGPWEGKLDNSRETVTLERPDAPNPDAVPYILVEEVEYRDVTPWPVEADGFGASMQRSVLSAYGNDPTNWFGSVATPGAENVLNLKPVVTLTAPDEGMVYQLPTNIVLTAEASDPDDALDRVEFYAGGTLIGVDATFPYQLDWASPWSGVYDLTARAFDSRLAWTESAAVSITVMTLKPSVTLIAPTSGSVLGDQQVLLLKADASDPDGSVVQVEFRRSGQSLGIDSTPPYEMAWTASPVGLHQLTAIALDDSGLISTSAVTQVTVVATDTQVVTPVPAGSVWRYLDDGSNQGTSWSAFSFNDSGWASGPAKLGYGEGDEGTVVSYGSNSRDKHITTYFRHSFELPGPVQGTALEVRVQRDDGVIMYLNGVELFRHLMPEGTVDSETVATAHVSYGDEDAFFSEVVDVTLLRAGTNVLAAELHQRNNRSSDLSFDAELVLTSLLRAPAITTHPGAKLRAVGESVTFSVIAEGAAPLSYQWRKNGTTILGATANELTLTNLSMTDVGDYAVVVLNTVGSAISQAAHLTVIGDLDDDGLPDAWENTHFPGVDIDLVDPDADPDWDGATNLEEYEAGTDPNNPWDAPANPDGGGIGINLREGSGGTTALAPTELAGYIVQDHWNNMAGTDAQPLVPMDADGDPTAMAIHWSLSNSGHHGGEATPDQRLGYGYFDDGDTPSLAAGDDAEADDGIGCSVTVSQVPYDRYTVVLYLNADQAAGGSFGSYAVNNQTQTGGSTPGDVSGRGWVLGENVLMYSGLTGTTCRIRGQARNLYTRGSLAGFQLIDTTVNLSALIPDITGFSLDPDLNTVFLEWSSRSGLNYQVQTTIASDVPWMDDSGAPQIRATNATSSWSGPLSSDSTNTWYRVMLTP